MLNLDFCTCTVRLGGNLLHEVNKEDITNLELKVLRKVHGTDAVVNVKRTRTQGVDEEQEYFRLARIYGKKVVEEVFRISLEDFDNWLEAQQERENREREEASKARQEKFLAEQRQQRIEALQREVKENAPAPAKTGNSEQPVNETVDA